MIKFVDYVLKIANIPCSAVGEFVDDVREDKGEYVGKNAFDFMSLVMDKTECYGDEWRAARICYSNYVRYCKKLKEDYEHLDVKRYRVAELVLDSYGVWVEHERVKESISKSQKIKIERQERNNN